MPFTKQFAYQKPNQYVDGSLSSKGSASKAYIAYHIYTAWEINKMSLNIQQVDAHLT